MDDTPRKPKAAAPGAAGPRWPARAELVWEGKYDDAGRKVAPQRLALPFQTVETVNETAQERQKSLFAPGFREAEWKNRLIWGDKKYVLPSLLPEFAGKVNLIYIDPPFDTGADFSFTATVPDDPETGGDDSFTFTKEPSIIEHKAYRDTWGRGLESYLQWFYETAILLHELLAENGSIYVHLDWHVSYYCKPILDEIFGPERFVNEIVWKRQTAKGDATQGATHMGRIHESVFFYSKSNNYLWNVLYTPYDDDYIEAAYRSRDLDGRRYTLSDITAPGGGKASKGNPRYEFLGVTRYWRFSKETMQRLYGEGRIVQTTPGAVPRQKRYLDEMPGVPLQDLWLDIVPVQGQSREALSYATQKPESLLDRIVSASSDENDLVLDCFCGSGTTAAVAEKLGRRWIACDLGRFAIHTTRKRLLSIPNVRPFEVQNLGKYERQQWAGTEFGAQGAAVPPPSQMGEGDHAQHGGGGGPVDAPSDGSGPGAAPSTAFGGPPPPFHGGGTEAAERQRAYVEFILKLAGATPIQGYSWLHGVRGGRMVHVGAVDAPVTTGDVTAIAAEFRRAVGTGKDAPKTNGVDLLGWDFAFEMNEVARQQAAQANIQMRFLRIPRDVMDKRAVAAGDIKFFELAALAVETAVNRRDLFLRLTDFVIPPDDVPDEARRAVTHWSQWIDYWAVDWDNRSDTFHNEWQAYRTRKDKSLTLEVSHRYAEPGDYAVVVKVIDILGNDTTKTMRVRIK